MAIRQLSLTDFRNLKSTTVDFHPSFNLVCGDNGSGKTSLLEAIYVLCQACSFRTHQLKQCINHDKGSLLLFGRFDDFKAGLSKSGKKLEIRIDGKAIQRRSELVLRSPVNIVNADSFALISGSPQIRRQFLDWCLFHVEHDYAQNWVKFKHALRQRNKLLKSRQDLKLLDYWDQHLIEPSLEISRLRQRYSVELDSMLQELTRGMLQGIPVTLAYQPGWTAGETLSVSLEKSRDRDIKTGFTNIGIHRDDLKLTTNGIPVIETLSRGQSKRLCLALLLSALKLVNENCPNKIILLIDDLHSELDAGARNKVYQELLTLDLQLFVSNIKNQVPDLIREKEFKLFHVEHGIIKPRKFS